MIELRDVSVKYSGNIIGLKNVNLKVNHGEFLFVTGPSGAGKSTIIKVLLKEIDPDSGKIYLEGDDITKISKRKIPKIRKKIGVVFQDFRLLKNRTVYENIEFVLDVHGFSKKDKENRIQKVLELVNLEDRKKSYPRELSGGEQQRVSIARALAISPKVLIADEPTGNLDPLAAWKLMDYFKLINSRGTTVIINTHSKELVDEMAVRVVSLENGEIVRDSVGGYENGDI